MLGLVGVVELGVVCVRDQVTPLAFKSLVRMAKKGCFSSVGTAAVVGSIETAIPESIERLMVPVPCLLESATDCAVIMTASPGNVVGLGRTDGARNVAVDR